MRINHLASSALLGATMTLAGCSDSTSAAAGRPATISFSTAATAGTSASLSPFGSPLRSVTATSGGNTIVITKAQIVVARMELERSGASCGSDAAAGDDEHDEATCAEMTVAPSIVDLPVDATITSPIQVAIPAGTYRALEAKIRPVRADSDHGSGSSAFLTAHPEFAGVTVRVEGTYNGTPFVYTGAPRAEFETVFNPPIVVDASPVNVTVHVDLATWFKDANGALVNPASTNAMDQATIAYSISRSFRAFHDDDRNDRDDAGEHHGG
jgi:hypothetical protein